MVHTRRRNDSAYKYLFSSKEVVHQLLTRFVDDDVMSSVGLDDIEPVDKSFVTDAFLDRESDMIYRVAVAGREVYIYVLIEFQSTVDKSIPIRMLHYILGLYDQMYRTGTSGKLPAVFPILLYVRELIEPTIAARYIPAFAYYAIIERDIPDETLEKIRGILSAVIYLEKRRDKAELHSTIDRVIEMVEAEQPEQLRMFKVWLNRMFRTAIAAEHNDRIDELRGVRSMLSDVIEQMRDEFRQEGLKEGLQEGLQEGFQEARRTYAVRMLHKGYPLEEVIEITELSRTEVETLAKHSAAESTEKRNNGGSR
jgi:predicted transposase/invertase (TIGR01784 family)